MSETRGVAPVPAETGSGLAHSAADEVSEAMTTPTGKRTTSPAFQFYPADFLSSSKVRRMSMTERGVYITLLSTCWLDDGLPSDLQKLASMLHISHQQLTRMWPQVLAECFYERDGKLHNSRIDVERKKQWEYRKKQGDNGKRGGRPKKPVGFSGLTQTKPNPNPNETQPEPKKSSLSLSLSLSSNKTPDGVLARAPLIDQREHRKHAHCGRVCLHASLFGEFVRRRNHDGADREVRDWALEVEREWGPGGIHADTEPGDAFDFWRTQYDLRWPATKVDPRVPQWAR